MWKIIQSIEDHFLYSPQTGLNSWVHPSWIKIPQSGICPAPCAFQQCASPFCFWVVLIVEVHLNFWGRLPSIKGRHPSIIVFHQSSSSLEGYLPFKVFFHQRSSPIKGRLPSKVIFHWRSSSIEDRLPSRVVLHRSPSSIKGHLPSRVILHWR